MALQVVDVVGLQCSSCSFVATGAQGIGANGDTPSTTEVLVDERYLGIQ